MSPGARRRPGRAPDGALRAAYARDAAACGRVWAPVLRSFTEPLLDALDLGRGARVLDVGCGTGASLRDLARRVGDAGLAVGIDAVPTLLPRGRRRAHVIAGDARRLPVRRAAFDTVIVAFVLHHIRFKRKVLEEARRALGRGGRIAVAAWGRGPMDCPAFLAWSDLLDMHGAPEDPSPHPTWHRLLETPPRLDRLLRGAGFRPASAWSEIREHRVTPDVFVAYALGMGILRDRLEAMPAPARAAFLRASARLVGSLDRSAFLWRGDVAFAIGRKP